MFSARGGFEYTPVVTTSTGYITMFDSTYDSTIAVPNSTGANVYMSVSGNVNATLDFGLIKLDGNGNIQWQRKLDSTGSDNPLYSTIDSSENIYSVGYTLNTGSGDMILVKYNSSGNIQWQRTLGNSAVLERFTGVVVESGGGNVYTAGYGNDISYFEKYNSSGTLQFQNKLNYAISDIQYMTIDTSNNIYTLGRHWTGSKYVAALSKMNSSGTLQFARQIYNASTIDTYGRAVQVDSGGNIFVGVTRPSTAAYIAKLNSSGTIQWIKGTTGLQTIQGMTVDPGGNVYLTAGGATYNYWYGKFDTSGNLLWQNYVQAGNGVPSLNSSDITYSNGNIYVSGRTDYPGSYSGMLVKTTSNGDILGTFSGGGFSFTIGTPSISFTDGNLNDATLSATVSSSTLTGATSTFANSASSYSQVLITT